MKALSIKQPWASLIAHGIKDIENRTWYTNYRGKIYIHSTAKEAGSLYELLSDEQLQQMNNILTSETLPHRPNSSIIGEVEIVDCVLNHNSIWAEATFIPIDETEGYPEKPIYNWVLRNPVLYDTPVTGVKGKLSLWEYKK
ncbi:ASCH domain-containing protein [Tenacibaculum sp. 190524A02b]|uniref:ASCH domain-containing protein n=1 Tax=Tenacibaculum vairaonense TaxID=3137860 RepID=UPI0031FA95E2